MICDSINNFEYIKLIKYVSVCLEIYITYFIFLFIKYLRNSFHLDFRNFNKLCLLFLSQNKARLTHKYFVVLSLAIAGLKII